MTLLSKQSCEIDLRSLTQHLIVVNRLSLYWNITEKQSTVPINLGGEAVAGSQSLLIHPDYLKASDDLDEIEQNI
jgi:hypothetical protein